MSQKKNNREYTEKNVTKAFVAVFVGIILVLMIVIVIMLCSKGGNTDSGDNSSQPGGDVIDPPIASEPLNNEVSMPELKMESIEEQEDVVLITTSYCTMSYPSAYYELITADVYYGDGTGCIIFSALAGGGKQTAYSLLFNNESGNEVGKLKLEGTDEPIRVSVVFYPAPDTLTGEAMNNYLAAQETFNDVLASLENNKGFTPTD